MDILHKRVKSKTAENHWKGQLCGAMFSEVDLELEFKDVEIRNHSCGDSIERLWL